MATQSYVEKIKAANPTAYAKIADLAKFTANENYGGNVQDYQAQIFTPLSADIINANKSLGLTYTPIVSYGWTTDDMGVPVEIKRGGEPIVPKGVQANTEFDGEGSAYRTYTKDLGLINGVPVKAVYDVSGNLTGYEGDSRTRSWINGKQSVSGKWDASGKPVPQQYTSSSGGFFSGLAGGLGDALSGIGDIFGDAKNAIGDLYMEVRDPLEAAAVVAGNYFVPGSSLLTSQIVSDDAKQILATDLGKAAMIGSGLAGSGVLSNASDAVGGVTGPDNIDVGGGWSPATGATAAELESARAALNGTVASPVLDANIVETLLPSLPVNNPVYGIADAPSNVVSTSVNPFGLQTPEIPATLEDLVKAINANAPDNIDIGGGFNPATGTGDLATAAAANTPVLSVDSVINNIANAADNIDMGGGYNVGTGTGDAVTAAAAENPVVLTASTVNPPILGNADRAALNSNAGYGDTLTSAQITAFDAAVASGMSVNDALNYARAGLFINAIVGDPLGLSGGINTSNGPTGSTGFAQVPIPAEWKSPTYAAPAAPIDLNSLFTDINLLGGTQWQGLVDQKPNVSFNDIFASGKQQTPMGSPVDINQIVSAILGQNTASQKPA